MKQRNMPTGLHLSLSACFVLPLLYHSEFLLRWKFSVNKYISAETRLVTTMLTAGNGEVGAITD